MRRNYARIALDGTTGLVLLTAIYLLTLPSSVPRTAWAGYQARRAMRDATNRIWPVLETTAAPLWHGVGSLQLVEVSDYDCPFCRASSAAVDSVVAHGVKVGYLHYPLAIHPHARSAAAAALCAEDQDNFSAMHEELMRDTTWHADTAWGTVVQHAGTVDTSAFSACMKSALTEQRIKQHSALAESLLVRGTPTFVSKRGVHQGTASVADLLRLVGAER